MTRTTIASRPAAQWAGSAAVERSLHAYAKALSHAVGAECPDCGSRETEDNGSTEYRCCACDHRWGIENGERYGF